MQLLEDISNKTAKYFGFDESSTARSSKLNESLIDKASNSASSLSDYLYYHPSTKGFGCMQMRVAGRGIVRMCVICLELLAVGLKSKNLEW